MVRCRLTLCCSPQPVARVLRVFPKLALIFLLLHVAVMLYSVLKPNPRLKPTSVSPSDDKMRLEDSKRMQEVHIKNLTALGTGDQLKRAGDGLQQKMAVNRTKLGALAMYKQIKSFNRENEI